MLRSRIGCFLFDVASVEPLHLLIMTRDSLSAGGEAEHIHPTSHYKESVKKLKMLHQQTVFGHLIGKQLDLGSLYQTIM